MFVKKPASLFVLFGALVLSACTHDPIVVTKYSPMELEAGLRTKVTEPEPPPKKKFIESSPEAQRDMLFIFSIHLQKALQQCNATIDSIDTVYQKHLKRVDQMNKASEK